MANQKKPKQMRSLSVNLRVDISIAERCQEVAKDMCPFDEREQRWTVIAAMLLDMELRRWEATKKRNRRLALADRMRGLAIAE